MSAHATFSPSGAHRWMPCPGSIRLEAQCPATTSAYAEEGTLAHEIAATLLAGQPTLTPCDAEMLQHIWTYVDNVKAYAGDGLVLVEQRLNLSGVLDTPDQFGTADAVVVLQNEIQVHDLKYGRGVQVFAFANEQLMLYALGAVAEFDMLCADLKQVRLVIHQPRLGHVSEWVCPIEDLLEFGAGARQSVVAALQPDAPLDPGEKQCRWCRAKAICPALRDHVLTTIADDFVDVTKPVAPVIEQALTRTFDNTILGNLLAACDLIEDWTKAIRAKVETELLAGNEVPGWKLVEGRRGARAWADAAEAEATLKAMRLKVEEMYDLKLISPTSAEKLHKAETLGPRQWQRLQTLITQPNGRPSVAPTSDKRPALDLKAAINEFDEVTA